MKKIIYLLLAIALVAGCNGKKKNAADTPKVQFGKAEYKEHSKLANAPETEIKADIPVAKGAEETAKNINDKIFATVKSIIGKEDDTSDNYESLFLGFIRDYEDFLAEFPDAYAGWGADIKGVASYNTNNIVNITIESFVFTGGAHGYGSHTSLIFNPDNGKEFFIGDIVKDVDALTQLAEKKFRKKFDIPAEGSINVTGLMFPDDKFILPENIFITEKGLNLFYNPYEIASYAEGSRELFIAYDDVKDNLKIDIR